MTRPTFLGVAALALIGCIHPPPPTAPVIYQHWTTDGRYVLAMAEDPTHYERRFSYQVTPEERATLDRFPVSGLYRAGDRRPLQEFEWPVQEDEIVALFTHDDQVCLVLRDAFGLRIYNGSKPAVVVDGLADGWVQAPWLYTGSPAWLGIQEGFDVELLRDLPKPRLRVQVLESATQVYDAISGEHLARGRLSTGAAVEPNVLEQDLLGLVAEFRALATARDVERARSLFWGRMAPVALTGCMEVDAYEDDLEELSADDDSFDDWSVVSVGLDVPYARRVLHADAETFDLYRLDRGKALPFMCGEELTEEEFLARTEGAGAEIWHELSNVRAAVAVMAASSDEGSDLRAGLITLWSHTRGEWRMIGLRPFLLPMSD